MAWSLAPYIHVILADVVSITLYINKPLVRLTTAHYQSAVSMISFAQVLTVQWCNTIPCQNVWFQVRITCHDIPVSTVIFSFLSLFPFTRHILSRPDWSQVIAPCSRDLTICFTTHEPCAHFTYHLYLRLLYLLWKTRKFSPELRLKFVPSHHFALLRLHTFALPHTPNTLHLIAMYWTSISHHFTLIDTTSGNHFTAPESHPSEPHRIYT